MDKRDRVYVGLSEFLEDALGSRRLFKVSHWPKKGVFDYSFRDRGVTCAMVRQERKRLEQFSIMVALPIFMRLNPAPSMPAAADSGIPDVADLLGKTIRVLKKRGRRLEDLLPLLRTGNEKEIVRRLHSYGYHEVKVPVSYCNLILRRVFKRFGRFTSRWEEYDDGDLARALGEVLSDVRAKARTGSRRCQVTVL